jgi:hypothetical protein
MATRVEWAERVGRWERSGLSAEKFARRERRPHAFRELAEQHRPRVLRFRPRFVRRTRFRALSCRRLLRHLVASMRKPT